MPAGAYSVRAWLHGLLAGLVALAAIVAPVQHERMMFGRAAAALAAADAHAAHGAGTPDHGHHEHFGASACFACVLMAAPGLPPVVFAGIASPSARAVVSRRISRARVRRAVPRAAHRPRAPPAAILA